MPLFSGMRLAFIIQLLFCPGQNCLSYLSRQRIMFDKYSRLAKSRVYLSSKNKDLNPEVVSTSISANDVISAISLTAGTTVGYNVFNLYSLNISH